VSKKYSTESKEKAISLYQEELSANRVSNILGVNEATIRMWLKNNNITIRDGSSYNIKHDSQTVEKIIELYNKGMYTTDIEKMLNLKRGIASYVLRKQGIDLRHRGPKSKIGNEEFFDVIDNELKAYFLGWIMADGNISITDGQYSLKIHISLKDRELIDKFLVSINSSNKTNVKQEGNPSYYVSLTSVHMCKSLINLGVTPRKSGKEPFPNQIPSNLYPHFIRGVFDGDGITCTGNSPRSGFVGSKHMLDRIIEIINTPDRKLIQNNKNKDIYYFLGGKSFSRKLYEFLYKDSTIWLQRKRERLEKICFE
jgi:intein-encoded DNA endonuclease-like protein